MRNNLEVTLAVIMISFMISSCDSSNTSTDSLKSKPSNSASQAQPAKAVANSKVTMFTKAQLESVLPKKLANMNRTKMSVFERQNALQAKTLYMSKDAKPKILKITLFDLSKLEGDKAQIQIYGQVNKGIFHQIDEKNSARFTRSVKISGYPAVIEESSMEMFGEKYKDSKLAILFDHRLYVEMEGGRLTVKELESLIKEFNLKLLSGWNY